MNKLIGTPIFMSPESLTAPDAVDGRSDLYSLGGVGYYLLTGTPMFDGTLMEVCAKHLHERPEPPSSRLGRPLPSDLEELILSCLEKEPSKRPQSAREFVEALRTCEVPRWTEADARRWWQQKDGAAWRAQVRRFTPSGERPVDVSALTVDIEERDALGS
jgi:serine/threonine-protein kinase